MLGSDKSPSFVCNSWFISHCALLFKSDTESLPKHTWFNPFFEFGISYPDDIAKGYILSSMYSSLVSGEPIKYGASKARMDLGLCFNLRHSQNIGNAWTDYPLPKISDLEKNINGKKFH